MEYVSKKKGIKNLIGTKEFYKRMLMIMVPIMVQNGITNLVGMLDNIMVGQIGTNQMSGVSIVNQLIFVFNVTLFGVVSGAGIFASQFFGKGDDEGIRFAIRFKLIAVTIISAFAIGLFMLKGRALISLYLHSGSDVGDLDATMKYAWGYLRIILISCIPVAICNVFSSTLRECGKTIPPMVAGLVSVGVNMMFNYVLIFGKLGMPKLGANGAAIATCIARFAELLVLLIWVNRNKDEVTYMKGAFKTFRIPGKLVGSMLLKGLPLAANEFLWSLGMATITQCYAHRGLAVVAGLNINSTIFNVFNVVFIASGSSIAIIVGQRLGAGETELAKKEDWQMIFFAVSASVVLGIALIGISFVFPLIYNTEPEVRALAASFIQVSALIMPFNAFTNAAYFTLRSGGKTIVTFLFDSFFTWVVVIPTAFVLSRFTALPILAIFAVVQAIDILKCIIGFILVKRGVWINNLTLNA